MNDSHILEYVRFLKMHEFMQLLGCVCVCVKIMEMMRKEKFLLYSRILLKKMKKKLFLKISLAATIMEFMMATNAGVNGSLLRQRLYMPFQCLLISKQKNILQLINV